MPKTIHDSIQTFNWNRIFNTNYILNNETEYINLKSEFDQQFKHPKLTQTENQIILNRMCELKLLQQLESFDHLRSQILDYLTALANSNNSRNNLQEINHHIQTLINQFNQNLPKSMQKNHLNQNLRPIQMPIDLKKFQNNLNILIGTDFLIITLNNTYFYQYRINRVISRNFNKFKINEQSTILQMLRFRRYLNRLNRQLIKHYIHKSNLHFETQFIDAILKKQLINNQQARQLTKQN